MKETASLLERAGWQLSEYKEGLRNYRLKSDRFPGLAAKVLHERDIPIQVAIGNYDLGICGLDWVEELTVKFPTASIVKIKELGYGRGALYVAGSRLAPDLNLESLCRQDGPVRIATEYPNLAELFALNRRFRNFSVFPVWGGADAYPPESASLALVAGGSEDSSLNNGLKSVSRVLDFGACLIANRRSWEQNDISEILSTFENIDAVAETAEKAIEKHEHPATGFFPFNGESGDIVRIALPDGHQQKPTLELLSRAGIRVEEYPSPSANRRPVIKLDGVAAKVIRPQDMPLQVACGNFDLAITGSDWLTDHKYMFPSSPVKSLLDLRFGWVRIVAVVCQDVNAGNIYELRELCAEKEMPVRVASEYVNLADEYARTNRLGMYRVVPTWGATEAFLPEDADILIENTETGSTIARHNLKIIDTLFESTAQLIGVADDNYSGKKRARVDSIVKLFRDALKDWK